MSAPSRNRRKDLSLAELGIATGAYDTTDTIQAQSESKVANEQCKFSDCIGAAPFGGYPAISMSEFTGEASGASGITGELQTFDVNLDPSGTPYNGTLYQYVLNHNQESDTQFNFQWENGTTGSYFRDKIASRYQNFSSQKGSPHHWKRYEETTDFYDYFDFEDGTTDDQDESVQMTAIGPPITGDYDGRLVGGFADCFNYQFVLAGSEFNNYIEISQSINIRVKKAAGGGS